MEPLRKLIRKLLEGIGEEPSSWSDPKVLKLVDDYIRQHVKGMDWGKYGGSVTSVERYGGAADYYLPIEAKAYFDSIGFKGYKVVKTRSKGSKSPWVQRVVVEFWKKMPEEKMTFDDQEIADFMSAYIKRHSIGGREVEGGYYEYEFPIDAKADFDEVGVPKHDYRVERATNKLHPDYGKQYVVLMWPKVV